MLASKGGGPRYIDTLKNKRARTVPLVAELVPIVDRWSAGKEPGAWLFAAPRGGPLRESNWKRSVGWRAVKASAGVPGARVHDYADARVMPTSGRSACSAAVNGLKMSA